jgi:D-aspartate ligase
MKYHDDAEHKLRSTAAGTIGESEAPTLDSSTPVVVFGCFRQSGIGIVRSLGRLGVPVYAVDPDGLEAAFFSKYCRGKFRWDVNGAPPSQSLDFLRQVGEKIGRRALLIPTSDVGAMFMAAEAQRLADVFLFPEQNEPLMRALCSKRGMYEIAKQWNIPTPETAFPASSEDVGRYLSSARFPVLVKPLYNKRPASGGKAWRMFLAHHQQELLEGFEAVRDPGEPNVILQEYIPGPDSATWTFNGYFDRNSNCLAGFTGRKLRNFPPYFGRASLAVCEKNEEVARAAAHFMKCIGYKGPLDIGFRYDARDGRYKVNDVNPRVGSMFRVFVGEDGMDIVRAMYRDLTGQPVTARAPKPGRKWITEDVDWLSSCRYWWDGNLTLKQWYGSLSGISETTFFARDDLMPVAGVFIQNARRGLDAAFAGLKGIMRRAWVAGSGLERRQRVACAWPRANPGTTDSAGIERP